MLFSTLLNSKIRERKKNSGENSSGKCFFLEKYKLRGYRTLVFTIRRATRIGEILPESATGTIYLMAQMRKNCIFKLSISTIR